MSYRSCAGRHKWRPYRVCHRVVVMACCFFHSCVWEPPGMSPCGRDVPPFFSSVHVGTAGSVGATFMSPACVRCCVVGRAACPVRGVLLRCVCAVVSRRCLPLRFCAGRHKWRPYRVCRRAVVMPRRFFIRACGNRRQCRGDIHVARVRALLRCAVFFIRACGNRRQRRGDIHVARVRAPLRPAVFHPYVWKPPAA